MIFLFRSGTPQEKIKLILRATRTHAQNLAKYATVYKLTMLMLKHIGSDPGKEGLFDTFFAGLLGGYLVFGRRSKRGHISSVSKQIVIFGTDSGLEGMLLQLTNSDSIRTCVSLVSEIIHRTLGRNYQESSTLETNITRCMASLCGAELGFSDVVI